MYTIGEVGKMMQVSANTLRYYDEIGLLRPEMVKDENQYRYYSKEQLDDISLIMELKEYGFTLKEIKKYLKDGRNGAELKAKLQEKRFDIVHQIEKLKTTNKLLEIRIESSETKEVELGKKRVLIVDDVEFMKDMQEKILEEYGFVVAGKACNGIEAVEQYKILKPDAVIMDIVMPEMDGIDALRSIKNLDKDAKVIMCSGKNYLEVVKEALETGALGFVPKPFMAQNLIEELNEIFDQNEEPKCRNFDVLDKLSMKFGTESNKKKITFSQIREIKNKLEDTNINMKEIDELYTSVVQMDNDEESHKIFKEIESEANLLKK